MLLYIKSILYDIRHRRRAFLLLYEKVKFHLIRRFIFQLIYASGFLLTTQTKEEKKHKQKRKKRSGIYFILQLYKTK